MQLLHEKTEATTETMTPDLERSRIMRAVKSRDTVPEMELRRLIFGMGYRYRLYNRNLPGTPDLVFSGRKKVIFVHGCFWHGHSCKRGARSPKENADYWRIKISRNRVRDDKNQEALSLLGWEYLVIWECELKDKEILSQKIKDFLD